MSEAKIDMKLEDLKKTLENLERSFEIKDSELRLESMTNRFRLCFQLLWKLVKYIMDELGVEVRDNPREKLAQAMTQGILPSSEDWHRMLKDRNALTHEYSKPDFARILNFIEMRYIELLRVAVKNIETEIQKLNPGKQP